MLAVYLSMPDWAPGLQLVSFAVATRLWCASQAGLMHMYTLDAVNARHTVV
jgi:hypothetical protein